MTCPPATGYRAQGNPKRTSGGLLAAALIRTGPTLSGADVVVLQRERTNTFTSCREERIEHRRRRHRDGGLADAAPESAGRHHFGLDLRHLVDPHDVVGVEVLLLDGAVLDGAFTIEQRGQAVGERAGHLPLD